MDTVSSSDYLSVKKRRELEDLYQEPNSSSYTENKQYLTIQTTFSNDQFEEIEEPKRFNKNLPYCDLAVVYPKTKNNYSFVPMFTVPKIQIEPYVKNKYVKPICWNCPLTACDICAFCQICTHCDLDRECGACEQTKFFRKTGMFFMNSPG